MAGEVSVVLADDVQSLKPHVAAPEATIIPPPPGLVKVPITELALEPLVSFVQIWLPPPVTVPALVKIGVPVKLSLPIVAEELMVAVAARFTFPPRQIV